MITKPLRFSILPLMLLLLSSCGAEAPAERPAAASPTPPSASPGSPVPTEVPQFIEVNYIDLDQIRAISLFRSGVGHDFSDSVESCRSMKHYFVPYDEVDWAAVPIYSPVHGEIIRLTEEWAGTQIQIRPEGYPEYFVVIFHVDLNPGLLVGQTVSAGQPLGTHISNQTNSDIAVGLDGQEGFRWVSYFEVMSDSVFAEYQLRGVPGRGALILSREERGADPLVCEGEQFTGSGNLKNYFQLDDNQ